MRICLITPPSIFLTDERVFCALGILKVGAVLEQAGHHVEHLDLSGITNYEDVVRDYCRTTPSVTFALTATTPQMPAASKVAAVIRECGSAKVILGGAHVTLVNAALKLQGEKGRALVPWLELRRDYDVLVCGDGEKAILLAIEIEHGVVDADDPKSSMWLTSQDFTDSPWPARHLVDISTYHYTVDSEPATSLVSQLGCPMGCNFCAGRSSPMLRRMRTRSHENAVAEIVSIYETYGLRGFMFFDDEVNINKQMLPLMRRLRDEARRLGIEWKLRGFVKAELFTDEQAEAMYEAGFRQVLVGFESGDDRILVNIQKNATREENTRAVNIAHNHGLKVKALMSVGHAGESEASILATRDWLLEVKPSEFDVTVIQPYPGSPYFDRALPHSDGIWYFTAPKTGDKLYMQDVDFVREAQYYKGMSGAYVSYVWTDHLTRERIVELRDAVEAEVRQKLNIPYASLGAALRYEHSMGGGFNHIPAHILRGKEQQHARTASTS